jgi:WD40 repeat protein
MLRQGILALIVALIMTGCGGNSSPSTPVPPTPTREGVVEDLGGAGTRPTPRPATDTIRWTEAAEALTAQNAAQIINTGVIRPPSPLGTIFHYSFSTDGTRIVMINDSYLMGYDLITGEMLFQTARQGAIFAYYSPDKSEVYTLTETGYGVVFDVARGRIRTDFLAHSDFADVADFYGLDGWLAVGGTDGTVRIWDTLQRQSLVAFNAHIGQITQLRFSEDGNILVTGGEDQRVIVWNWREREPIYVIENGGRVTNVAVSSDNQFVASGAEEFVSVWQISNVGGSYRYTLNSEEGGQGILSFSPDGRYLLTGGLATEISVWDATTGDLLALLPQMMGTRTSATFNPNSDLLAVSTMDTVVHLFDLPSLSASTLRAAQINATDRIISVAFSPDGFTLLMFEAGGRISVWGVLSEAN